MTLPAFIVPVSASKKLVVAPSAYTTTVDPVAGSVIVVGNSI